MALLCLAAPDPHVERTTCPTIHKPYNGLYYNVGMRYNSMLWKSSHTVTRNPSAAKVIDPLL
jgi:hypothetical protein